MKGIMIRWIAILGVAGIAGTAQAAQLSCTSATTYSLSNASATACFSGNDSNTIDGSFEMFGLEGWVLSEKNDGPDGNGKITFTSAPENGVKSGNWEIDTLAGLSNVVITLKAGNGFGAFLLDLTANDPRSGLWAAGKGLSHASIYYQIDLVSVNSVPLPAAAWLFLSALGGLVAVKRKPR